MDWLQAIDHALFRFGNLTLSNPLFDRVMPFLSGNPLFIPAVTAAVLWLLVKGGARGRLCVFFLLLVIAIGDGIICNALKDAFARPRPFNDLADAITRVGRGGSGSMPSSHAANWFAGGTVLFLFYRRSLCWTLPLALLVGFSRIYNGVHYPSDVLVGGLLGAGYALGILGGVNALWRGLGPRIFPLWFERLPSLLLLREVRSIPGLGLVRDETERARLADQQWLRLAYVLIGVTLVARLAYHASGKIELSEDEAYQWLWSKHPALSYYSKPPMIAYTQWLGTHLWGDTELGVRFFSSVIAAVMSVLMLRFLTREAGLRAGLWAAFLPLGMPLLVVGATLMTIDPLNVLFWTLAMVAGWRAVHSQATGQWLQVGLWMGLGFLSKYTALFQLLSWAVFFALWGPARRCLATRGPWLALGVNALCTIPVLVWNAQNGWITVEHLANRGGLDRAWKFNPNFLIDFVVVVPLLLNPVIFLGMVWAAVAFWRRDRGNALMVYCFSMGAPLFLFYFLYTLRARVQPNWIAPSIVPLLLLAVIFWDRRWREGVRWFKPWLVGAFTVVAGVMVVLHDTNLVHKLTGNSLPARKDPLRRLRGWAELTRVVEAKRQELAKEGRPVFIIGGHYGITGLMSFYHPEARAVAGTTPLVYYRSTDRPENQFYFWPGYRGQRRGQHAIYVIREDSPQPTPELLIEQFADVRDLGIHEVSYRGRVFHRVQLFECRDLR